MRAAILLLGTLIAVEEPSLARHSDPLPLSPAPSSPQRKGPSRENLREQSDDSSSARRAAHTEAGAIDSRRMAPGEVGRATAPPAKKPARPQDKPGLEQPSETLAEKLVWLLVSGLLLAVIAAVLGTLIYDRLRRSVRIRVVSDPKSPHVSKVHALYLQTIAPAERVSPAYLTDYLSKPGLGICSVRRFFRQAGRGCLPPASHLLMTATCQGEAVGLVKAIYVASQRLLFIAYVAVQAEDASVERRAIQGLLAKVRAFTQPPSPVEWIAFEITNDDTRQAKAKERLFRQYGQMLGVDVKRIAIDYLQPDLDCAVMSENAEEPAMLYLGSARALPPDVSRPLVASILEAILCEIYLPMWLIDHPISARPGLESYVRDLAGLFLQGVPDRVRLV